jgi:diguanylate cyclase (GGDEF)-like protein
MLEAWAADPSSAHVVDGLRLAAIGLPCLAALAATRFNLGRLVLSSATLACVAMVARDGHVPLGAEGACVLACGLALNLAGLALTRDRVLLGPGGWLQVLAFVGASLGVAFASTGGRADVVVRLMGAPAVGAVPWSAMGLATLAGMLLTLRSGRDGDLVGPALFAALVGATAALGAPALPAHAALLILPAAGACLLVAVHAVAWRRAHVDELTALPGRRALDDALDSLFGDHAIAVVDVDHFKRFNDRHGHDAGDAVLRLVARQLAQVSGARAFRQGGEEFVLVFRGENAPAAEDALEELRAAVAAMPLKLRGRRAPRAGLRVTVSIGVARRAGAAVRPRDVLRAADLALLRAKRGGRNRVDLARTVRRAA